MSRIYQVKFLGKSRDDVDFTLVFNGPNGNATTNQTNTYYTDTFIHMDDTVEIIKQKILDQVASRVSLPHITGLKSNDLYLFGHVEETVYAEKIKQMISADNDGRINHIPFDYAFNLLANFGLTANKDAWTIDELISRVFTQNETKKRVQITKQIGQHGPFMKIGKKHLAVADPYSDWRQDDRIMLKPVNRNPYMLFETFSQDGAIVDNTIYCVWAKALSDALSEILSEILSEPKTEPKNEQKEKWYFPLLKKPEPTVREIQQLHRSMRIADELYGMQFPADYVNPFAFGIEQFRVTLHPITTVKFPLFTVFKQFVSSAQHPLIKYNPRNSTRLFLDNQNNNEFIMEDDNEKGAIYKLYSDAVTTDDEKIPFLAKENINTFIMQRGKKSLSIYVHKLKYKRHHYYLTCEIHADGSISVFSTYPYETFTALIDVNDVQAIAQLALQPILAEIKPLLKSFYSMDVVDMNLYASNVTVDSISYALFYDKNVRQKIKDKEKEKNPLTTELIQPEPVDETELKIRATTRNKRMYAKVSNLKRIGFPIVFEDQKMSITKINSLYYLDVMAIYFKALFYQLSAGVHAPLDLGSVADVSPIKTMEKLAAKVTVKDEEDSDEDSDDDDSAAWASDSDGDGDGNDLMDDLEMFGGHGISGSEPFSGGGGSVGDRNPFVTKMKQVMPDLFKENITKMDLKLNKYSRICQNNEPLILTNAEKETLTKSQKINDPQKDLLEYGTDAHGKSLYFTCPKYYCMKEGQEGPVSDKDIEAGKCGPITDVKDAIFTDIKKRGNKHVYLPYGDDALFPGFNSSRLQNGFCSPCCFKKIGKKHMEKKKECQSEFGEAEAEADVGEKAKSVTTKKHETMTKADSVVLQTLKTLKTLQKAADNIYILGSDSSVPLPNKRWGYLPSILQEFLNNASSVCTQEKNSTINSSSNYNCLLRYGVEDSPNKSFIATISNMLFYQKASSAVLSVQDMCEYLVDHIRLDDFLLAQNGNLFAVFNSDFNKNMTLSVRDITTKYNSVILSKVDLTNPLIHDFVLALMQAFENFRAYLVDPESHVDYTYLWDILCTPNPHFFKDGMNMCILEMDKDLNQVGLVCPTNHSSNAAFDKEKSTYFMLMSHDHFFEPIYLHKKEIVSKKQMIQNVYKNFSFDTSILFMRDVIRRVIKPTFQNQCVSTELLYDITELLRKLQQKNYSLQQLVMNFVGQIVGITAIATANKSSFVGFIPCVASSFYPDSNNEKNKAIASYSAIASYPPLLFIHELPAQPYDKTIAFYHGLKKSMDYSDVIQITNHKGNAIGLFITGYDMFVPFSKEKTAPLSPLFPAEKRADVADMHQANLETQLSDEKDEERVNYTNRIQLDTYFYNLFKNTMRDLVLSDAGYETLQQQCVTNASAINYLTQLETVKNTLEKIGNSTIQFSKMDDTSARLMSTTTDSLPNDVIVLPKDHLLTRTNNKQIYYTKLADELIRFKQISHLFFNKKQFMLFQTLDHAIQPHEILILESQLLYKNREYLRNIKALLDKVKNPYMLKTTYDNAGNLMERPQAESYAVLMDAEQSTALSEILSEILSEDVGKDGPTIVAAECVGKPRAIDSSYILKSRCFKDPSQYMELPYDGHPGCGLGLIVDLVHILFGQNLTVKIVKERLVGLYESLMIHPVNKKNVMKILLKDFQDRKEVDFVRNEMKQMRDVILLPTFYPVTFDLWLLLDYFKIPSVLISNLNIHEAHQFANKKMFICYQDNRESRVSKTKDFVYIRVPPMSHNVVHFPKYHLITKDTKTAIAIDDLKPADIVFPIASCSIQPPPQITIADYVKNYVSPNYKYGEQ
jgi:hypothetical protein